MPPTCRCPTCEKKSEVRSENDSKGEETYRVGNGHQAVIVCVDLARDKVDGGGLVDAVLRASVPQVARGHIVLNVPLGHVEVTRGVLGDELKLLESKLMRIVVKVGEDELPVDLVVGQVVNVDVIEFDEELPVLAAPPPALVGRDVTRWVPLGVEVLRASDIREVRKVAWT